MGNKSKKVRVVCPECKYTYEDSYQDQFSMSKCPDCLRIWGISETGKLYKVDVFYKKHKDVVGFAKDEHGQEVAIDTKGKRIDPSETRYDTKKDPHGWRATGKKVKGYAKK